MSNLATFADAARQNRDILHILIAKSADKSRMVMAFGLSSGLRITSDVLDEPVRLPKLGQWVSICQSAAEGTEATLHCDDADQPVGLADERFHEVLDASGLLVTEAVFERYDASGLNRYIVLEDKGTGLTELTVRVIRNGQPLLNAVLPTAFSERTLEATLEATLRWVREEMGFDELLAALDALR